MTIDEALDIAQDPEKLAQYPGAEPWEHEGVMGRRWTFPEHIDGADYLADRPGVILLEDGSFWEARREDSPARSLLQQSQAAA